MKTTIQEKVKKLQVYLEKCHQSVKDAKNEHIKAFFGREVSRTQKSIEKLVG